MKAKIFSYKDVIGIEVSEETPLLNDIRQPSQIGMIIDTQNIQITKEAKELLSNESNYERERGSFAPLMLTKHADGSGSSLGFLNFYKFAAAKPYPLGRDCEIGVIDDIEVAEFEIPDDFIVFVESSDGLRV